MRCIVVNGAKLKAECCCSHCGSKIGETYLREIGSRALYCDFACYTVAEQTPILSLGFRSPAINAWRGA